MSHIASVGPADPQSWNRYSYTRNDPINRTDRKGLNDEGDDFEEFDFGESSGNTYVDLSLALEGGGTGGPDTVTSRLLQPTPTLFTSSDVTGVDSQNNPIIGDATIPQSTTVKSNADGVGQESSPGSGNLQLIPGTTPPLNKTSLPQLVAGPSAPPPPPPPPSDPSLCDGLRLGGARGSYTGYLGCALEKTFCDAADSIGYAVSGTSGVGSVGSPINTKTIGVIGVIITGVIRNPISPYGLVGSTFLLGEALSTRQYCGAYYYGQ